MVKSTINHHFQVHIRFATLVITPENGVTGDSTPRIVEMSSGQDLMSCISSFGSTKHGEISKRKLHKITIF